MNFNPYSEPASNEELAAQSQKIDKLIKSVLLTEQGLKFLGYLEKITILQTVMPLDRPSHYGYFREGQNDLVRQLIQALERDNPEAGLLDKARRSFKKFITNQQ